MFVYLWFFRQQDGISKNLSVKECFPVHVIFYETENGTAPAKDFIFSLDPKLKAKVLYVIDKGQKDKYNEEKSNCQGSADKMRSPRCAKMDG